MAFDLSDYVDVAERIREFRDKYPEGSLQSEIVSSTVEGFVIVKAFAYRTPDDPRPGIGHAWEPLPGRTPYTKDSELQNAETSAWGRSIVAVGAADTKRGIASRDEVQGRAAGKRDAETKGGRPSGGGNPVAPSRSGGKSSIPPSKDETVGASSQLSTTPSSDAGVEESDVLGKDGASTPPVSEHVHDWEPAPNKDAADRGYVVCKTCRVSKKDPV